MTMSKYASIFTAISPYIFFSGDVAWVNIGQDSAEHIQAVCQYYMDHPQRAAQWKAIDLSSPIDDHSQDIRTDTPDDPPAAVAPEKIWTVKDKVSLKQIEEADDAQVITVVNRALLNARRLKGLVRREKLDDEVRQAYAPYIPADADQLINAYLHLINVKHPDTWIFNTFFYPELKSKGNESVSKWTKKAKENIFDYKFIVIPLHWTAESHWSVCIVRMSHCILEFHNSIETCGDTDEADTKITAYLEYEWNRKCQNKPVPKFQATDIVSLTEVPCCYR